MLIAIWKWNSIAIRKWNSITTSLKDFSLQQQFKRISWTKSRQISMSEKLEHQVDMGFASTNVNFEAICTFPEFSYWRLVVTLVVASVFLSQHFVKWWNLWMVFSHSPWGGAALKSYLMQKNLFWTFCTHRWRGRKILGRDLSLPTETFTNYFILISVTIFSLISEEFFH